MKYQPPPPDIHNDNVVEASLLKEFAFPAFIACLLLVLLFTALDFAMGFLPIPEKVQEVVTGTITGKFKLDSDPKSKKIQDILKKLVAVSEFKESPSLNTFCANMPNAFALPGNNILISNELIKLLQSENGLAFVIAHEMGHLHHRHHLRALRRGIALTALATLLGSDFLGNVATRFLSVYSLRFSRDQERESDEYALDLMQKAYGHAKGSDEFFRGIQNTKYADDWVPAFFSTHPAGQERIDTLQEAIHKGPDQPTLPLNVDRMVCP